MRDLAITLIVLVGCFYTFKRPYIGVLLWSWLSYMNPHRLAYGFAYAMPFAQITAIVLIVSMVMSKETRKLPFNGLILIWILFIIYMGITTLYAYYPDNAWDYYMRVIKIQLIVFITMMLITDTDKIRQLIWVIVISIGYFSVKGGLFTILTGGSYIVWGPEGSMISGNNELAVATLMTIPLMIYLHRIHSQQWIKKGLLAAITLSFIAAIGTQSRGALLAFGAVALFFWIKSDKKIIIGVGMIILSATILALMPESWYARMNTIQTYEEDASAMGRLNAWEYAFNAANDRLLGMGFDSWSRKTFALYAPNPEDAHAAHSIYFSVLGDHGWIGLILFLIIFKTTWNIIKAIIKNTENNEDLKELNFLSKMMQVSFIAYLVGGAFLSLSYYDLPWHLISIVICIQKILSTSSSNPVESTKRLKLVSRTNANDINTLKI